MRLNPTDSALTDASLTYEDKSIREIESALAHLKQNEYESAKVHAQLSTTYATLHLASVGRMAA